MKTETPLSGQVALITGATRGIGLAIARRLGQMGARVSVFGGIFNKREPPFPAATPEGAREITSPQHSS